MCQRNFKFSQQCGGFTPLYPPSVSPPPPPRLFLGLKTEEGNGVCVWMKLKLEAEWHCSGTGKSSQLPACVHVCVLLMVRGGQWGRERQNFSIWGATAAQTRLQTWSHPNPPHTQSEIHTGTNMLLVPCRRAESSRSLVTTLSSVNSSGAARKKMISHPSHSQVFLQTATSNDTMRWTEITSGYRQPVILRKYKITFSHWTPF